MTSRKIVIVSWTPWTVVSRSWLMSLIMTFMLEPAKLQMNWARARGTRTLRRAADGRPAETCSAMLHLLSKSRWAWSTGQSPPRRVTRASSAAHDGGGTAAARFVGPRGDRWSYTVGVAPCAAALLVQF